MAADITRTSLDDSLRDVTRAEIIIVIEMPRYTFLALLSRSRVTTAVEPCFVGHEMDPADRRLTLRDRDFSIGGSETTRAICRFTKYLSEKTRCAIMHATTLLDRRGRPATGVHGQLDTAPNGRRRSPLLGFVTRQRLLT